MSAPRPRTAAPRVGPDPTLRARVRRLRQSVMHDVLDVLHDPWALTIVAALSAGPLRFEALSRRKIPRATLAARLRSLRAAGLVDDGDHGYALSDSGRGLGDVTAVFAAWNLENADAGSADAFRRACGACGRDLFAVVVCAACDAPVRAVDTRVLEAPGLVDDRARLPPPPRYRRGRSAHGLPARPRVEDLLGDRWVALVLGAALLGLRRFTDVEGALGIAPNMLAQRLRALKHAGIVRADDDDAALLTERGLALFPSIVALLHWGEATFDKRATDHGRLHKPCAQWLVPRLRCRACGVVLDGGGAPGLVRRPG